MDGTAQRRKGALIGSALRHGAVSARRKGAARRGKVLHRFASPPNRSPYLHSPRVVPPPVVSLRRRSASDDVAPMMDEVALLRDGVATPIDGVAAPRNGPAPLTGGVAPLTGGVAPLWGGVALLVDGVAPPRGDVASQRDVVVPRGMVSVRRGIASLSHGMVFPCHRFAGGWRRSMAGRPCSVCECRRVRALLRHGMVSLRQGKARSTDEWSLFAEDRRRTVSLAVPCPPPPTLHRPPPPVQHSPHSDRCGVPQCCLSPSHPRP